MTTRTQRRDAMGKSTKILLYYIVFLFLISSVHAQAFNPGAVGQAITNQLSGVRDWYAIEGHQVDNNGKQVPLFNSQYRGARMFIDFSLILLLLGLILRKNEYLKGMGKGAPVIVAFIVAFGFVFGANAGLITSFIPFVLNIPIIATAALIYFGVSALMGGKAEEGFSGKKIGILLVSILIAVVLFYGLNQVDALSKIAKIPGFDSTGAGADDIRGRIQLGETYVPPEVSFNKAKALFDNAQKSFDNAQKLFSEKKDAEAKTEIELAKKLNADGAAIAK